MTSRLRLVAVAALAASVMTVSACGSISVNALPQPGPSYRDGHDIVMQFETVLNLPERAKVVLDGVTVGVVSKVTLRGRDVDVTARVDADVVIPSDIHAVLEQATVLGDIYVALERPAPGAAPAPPLAAGATIPIAQTTSPPQLEDTIASLANFVSSGSIQRAQDTIIRLNRVLPSSDEVRRLTTRVDTNLSALSANLDQVDELLDGVAGTAAVVNDRISKVQLWFSPKGQLGFERIVDIATFTAQGLIGVGSITGGGYWLVPFLNSLADSVGALQQSKVAGEAEIPKYRDLFTGLFLPVDKYPAINITSIVGPDGREMSGKVQDVLRILGAMP
jgi:phospholipid/cholesterol/gamma-HCH transport system substrate-binding protein